NKEQYHIVNVENTLILAKEIFPLLYNDNTTKINKEVFLGRVDISDDWVILGYKSKIFEENSIKIGHNIKINNDLIQIKTENTNLELTNNGLFINNKKVCTALDVPPLISYKKVNDIIYGTEIIPKKNIFIIPDYFFASELFNKNSHYITEAVLKNDIIFSRRAIIPTELLISHEEIFSQKHLIKEATNSSENNIIYKGTSKITLDELTKTIENLWQKNKILIDYNNYIEKIYFTKEITESNQLIEDCHKTIQIKEKEIQNFKDSPLSSKDHYKPTFVEYLIPQIDFISSKDYYSPIFIDPVTFIEKIFIHNKWVYETSLLQEIIDGYFIVKDQSNTITSILKNQIVLETINRTENVISSKDNYSPIFIEQLKAIEAFEFVKWQYSYLIQYESILSEILKPKKYYIITDELSFIDTFCSSFYNKDEYSITDELIFKT